MFLDEVGDMSAGTQAKVLRVLDEQEFERVGGKKTVRVDVRVIAATNHDLEAKIAQGEFRPDLYFRLNVIPIRVPPLREHFEDIRPIAEHFLAQFAMENDRKPKRLSREALRILTGYHWPGNVREHRNIMERLVILAPGEEVAPADLAGIIPGIERPGAQMVQTAPVADSESLLARFDTNELRDAVAEFERELILRRLKACDGNVKRTAEELGLERSHLYKKMRALGIDPANRSLLQ
jgi:two-component system nitrogen regulation response regulator NtrX